jgi:hypothetical protein
MDIKIESKMVVETTAHFHDGKLKTHPCELHGWWGEDTCKQVDFNSEIEKVALPEGEYKVTIILEKVND